ncbi:MAG: nucleotidyltransferase domain-containing protein [Patescibacteria group bacterium]
MVIKAERKKLKKEEVERIINELKNKLKEEQIPFQQFWLFGSYFKGTADVDSDLDVAIVLPSGLSGASRRKVNDIAWWAKQVHVKLEPHVLSDRDLKNPLLSLPAEIKKHGMRV